MLKNCLYELCRVLGDTVQAPQCIATVLRLGYRFIAPVTLMSPVDAATSVPPAPSQAADIPPRHTPGPRLASPASPLVGREAVRQRLHAALAPTHQGRRQVVVLTGEPGIGKTAVVAR